MPLNCPVPQILDFHRQFVVHLLEHAGLNTMQWDVALTQCLWDLTNIQDQWVKKPCIAQSIILACQRNMLSELVTNTVFLFQPPLSIHPFFFAFPDCTQERSSEMHSGKNEPSSPSYPVPAWIWERCSTKPECSWACSIFNHIKSCSELMVSNLLWVLYDSLSRALELGHFPLWCWV